MPQLVAAQEPIPVVATFSILGDMVKRIGGNEIAVTTLVGRNGDTHVYQPTPTDAKAVKEAKILFTNGLQFEGWLERLAEAAAFDGSTVVTTDGIKLISLEHHDDEKHDDEKHADKDKHSDHDDEDKHAGHDGHDHGEFDPHGWLSLKNALTYVENITAALSKAAPEKAATFYKNQAAYIAEIESLDRKISDMIGALPESARTIITSHDAFGYFGRDYGLKFLAPQGLSTESEASARDVAKLIKQIRADGIAAVFVENVADPRLLQQIATETGSRIGGKLYPGALSDSDGPAATYLDLMRHNATTITSALTQ
jgi:zinc/manganese transport system substrate-binding protein